LLCSCSWFQDQEEERELRDFYLQQFRDPELVGWWKALYLYEPEKAERRAYRQYTAEGITRNYTYTDVGDFAGKYTAGGELYWYTKSDTLMTYRYSSSWFYGSTESSTNYFIRNDSLYFSDGLSSDKFMVRYVRSEALPADSIGG
jgi:hypothetical protein